MSSLRPTPSEELERAINALLPEGQRVTVHERKDRDEATLYCLIFQSGSRRHVVEERSAFTMADVGMIVDAVQRWGAGPAKARRPAYDWPAIPG